MTLKIILTSLIIVTFTGCVTTKHHITIDHNIKIVVEQETVEMLRDMITPETNSTKKIIHEKKNIKD